MSVKCLEGQTEVNILAQSLSFILKRNLCIKWKSLYLLTLTLHSFL